MWLRKIKRKKMQFLLVAIMLFSASTILAGCMIFVMESNAYLNDYYSKEKCYDEFAYINDDKAIELLNQKAVEDSKITKKDKMDAVMVTDIYQLNGENATPFYLFIYKISDYKKIPFDLTIDKGNDQACPGDNEIWVSKVYAKAKNVKIGDTMKFQDTTLKISGIVKNALSPNSLMSPTPFFCNEKTYDTLIAKNKKAYLFAASADGDMNYVHDFVRKALNENSQSIVFQLERDVAKGCVSTVVSVLGGIGTIAAFMIFIVSVIIIKFIIRNNLMKEYRIIGIHKSLGDSDQKIKGFYIKSYMIVGVVAISLGAVCGIPLGVIMGNMLLNDLSSMKLTGITFEVIAICILVLLAVLYFNISRVLKQIKKITPVEAIQMGMSSSKKKMKKSLIRNANSSFVMALNDIFKHKGNSFMMVLMLAFSFYLCVAFVNMDYSMMKMSENANLWFAVPKSDAMVSGNISQEVYDYVKQSKYVDHAITANLIGSFVIDGISEDGISYKNIIPTVFDTWSSDLTKVYFEEGRGPENRNEIAVNTKVLKESKYHVGDYITFRVNGKENTFLITGSYASLMQDGKTIAFHSDIYKWMDFQGNWIQYQFIFLKNAHEYEGFRQDLLNHFTGVAVDKILPEIDSAGSSMQDIINPVVILLVVVFILFSVINIINLLAMESLNNRRTFGVLKAMGRTNGYICMKCIWKITILSMISMAFAMGIHLSCDKTLFKLASGTNGLVNSTFYTVFIMAVIMAIILVVALMFCVPIRKIAPKDLMEE